MRERTSGERPVSILTRSHVDGASSCTVGLVVGEMFVNDEGVEFINLLLLTYLCTDHI